MLAQCQHSLGFQPHLLSMDLQLTGEICLHKYSFALSLLTIIIRTVWRSTESHNVLSWKGPIRIIMSSSWTCPEHPNNPFLPQSIAQTLLELRQAWCCHHSLESLFQHLWVRNLFLKGPWNLRTSCITATAKRGFRFYHSLQEL